MEQGSGISYQVILELTSARPVPEERLEDLAEACLTALNHSARLLALGPVVSADFARNVIEVEFTAGGATFDDVNKKAESVSRIMREVLERHDGEDGFAYPKSQTQRLAAVS